MKTILILGFLGLFGGNAHAASALATACADDLARFKCDASGSDHEIHECLEKHEKHGKKAKFEGFKQKCFEAHQAYESSSGHAESEEQEHKK